MENPSALQLAQAIERLESFKAGVLTSLVALKAAIQDSPSFNQQALEDCVTFFLASPPDVAVRDEFEWPLRTLLNDQAALLKGTLRRE